MLFMPDINSTKRGGVCNPAPNVSSVPELTKTFRAGQHAPPGFPVQLSGQSLIFPH